MIDMIMFKIYIVKGLSWGIFLKSYDF
jgi:hypothetical protein